MASSAARGAPFCEVPRKVERIRLLLLIDYVLVRESLGRQLRLEPDLEIVAEPGSPDDGLAALAQTPVDVVLLDCDAVRGEAAPFILAARQSGYQGRILVLASEKDTKGLFRPLRHGASGVFFKHNSLDSLPRAIRQVAAGEAWLDLTVVRVLASAVSDNVNRDLRERLTGREQQVLDGVLGGLTNNGIAGKLAISEGAAKAALRQIFRKAGVQSRSQLVHVALTGHD